jgi:hypothetical protein
MLKALPEAHLLEHEEVLGFLEARRRVWYWLGGCSSPRFSAAHRVHDLDI